MTTCITIPNPPPPYRLDKSQQATSICHRLFLLTQPLLPLLLLLLTILLPVLSIKKSSFTLHYRSHCHCHCSSRCPRTGPWSQHSPTRLLSRRRYCMLTFLALSSSRASRVLVDIASSYRHSVSFLLDSTQCGYRGNSWLAATMRLIAVQRERKRKLGLHSSLGRFLYFFHVLLADLIGQEAGGRKAVART